MYEAEHAESAHKTQLQPSANNFITPGNLQGYLIHGYPVFVIKQACSE